MRFALNAPARPRFEVSNRIAARRGPPWAGAAGRRTSGNRSTSSGVMRSPITSRSASAYGRAAWTRSVAFFSLLVEISSIVRVIFRVFWTERMRRLSARLTPAIGSLLRHEERFEAGDRRLERVRRLVVERLLGADDVQHLRLLRVEVAEEIPLPLPDLRHRDVVEIPVGDRVDDRHLPLDRHRLVLRLLQDLDQPRPPGQLPLGRRVEVRA